MTGQQLKASIFQLAIQGKLVPQYPDDEPAALLLERIRKEKEKLIKEKKISADKNPSRIFRGVDGLFYEKIGKKEPVLIQDEIPFDIPESWEWARLGVISTYGCTKQKVKASDVNPSLWGLDLEDIEKGGKILERKTVGERSSKGDKTVFKNGDILYSKLRPYLLKILVATDDGVCSSEIVPFHVYGEIVADYIVTYLKSPYVDNLINGTTYGVKMPRVGTETMTALLVPLPPLSEQKRIVDKLNEVLPLVDKYGDVEKELSDFNASFPKEMKKSILQYAIQGKLVPQNPDDEPASVLLERIRQEKKKLMKSGVIKKDKHESVIYKRDGSYFEKIDGKERCIDDEIPFDIPESWEWARLGVISTYGCTKQKVKASDVNPSLWGLDLEDIEKGGKILERKTVGERSSKGDKTVFKNGDILYSKLRPYLLKILVATDDGVCSSEIVPFHVYGEIVADYIVTYLKSPYVDNLINGTTYGVKMPRVGTETMTALLVPLPPISEQKRIVEKLETILPYLSFEDKAVEE